MQPYGGFWIRVLAYLIDSVVLAIGGGIIGGILGALIGLGMAGGGSSEQIALASGAVGNVVGIILNWLYFSLMESSAWQATLGKKALGLVVTDLDGRRIGFGRATGRHFGKMVSAIILGIGFMMAGWTQRKQGLHDMMASTLVWRASSPELVTQDASVFE